MAENRMLSVRRLNLDLANYRNMPQESELEAIKAMVVIKPVWFWALVSSIVDNGYLLLENILVLESSKGNFVVKEGNRRVAALKLILGHVPRDVVNIPLDVVKKLDAISSDWVADNTSVPCTIFSRHEESKVKLTVSLAHGKNEHAGKLAWESVATARHNRDENNANEPALDLLEKYLAGGEVSTEKAVLWAGDYNLTVLAEAMQKLASLFGAKNAPELSNQYPADTKDRQSLERLIRDIGEEKLSFDDLRPVTKELLARYSLETSSSSGDTVANTDESSSDTSHSSESTRALGESHSSGQQPGQPSGVGTPASASDGARAGGGGLATRRKKRAVALNDPRSVRRALKNFKIVGQNREKVVVLRNEAQRLDLKVTPFAFCFILRSMFEISAKAYCSDHKASGGPLAEKNGIDRKLVDVLGDIVDHLTSVNKGMNKHLHGAMVELGKREGVLSVTSMNQLVHNPIFSATVTDICVVFHSIFPLLEEMNR